MDQLPHINKFFLFQSIWYFLKFLFTIIYNYALLNKFNAFNTVITTLVTFGLNFIPWLFCEYVIRSKSRSLTNNIRSQLGQFMLILQFLTLVVYNVESQVLIVGPCQPITFYYGWQMMSLLASVISVTAFVGSFILQIFVFGFFQIYTSTRLLMNGVYTQYDIINVLRTCV